MKTNLKTKTIYSVIWSFIGLLLNKGLATITTILLAWFLIPEDYALIAMLAVFIQLTTFFVDAGFSEALIRKNDASQVDYSSVFFLNIALSFIIYVVMFFLAPYIALFYGEEILVPLVRFISLGLFFNALIVVQKVILTKKLMFKAQVAITIPAALISSILAIVLAYLEFGVWSLAWQIILNSLLISILYWFKKVWKPCFIFSFVSIKSLFKFSFFLILERLTNIPFRNMYFIFLPKYFLIGPVGLYFFAVKIKDIVIDILLKSIVKATYPILSSLQEDNDKLKSGYRNIIAVSTFLTFPCLILLATFAPAVTSLFLTDKWSDITIFLQLICISSLLVPLHSLNINILKVKGRTNVIFYVGLFKKLISIFIFIFTLQFNIETVIMGQFLASVISYIPNAYYSLKLINYSFFEQFQDSIPSLCLSVFVAVIIYFLQGLVGWNELTEFLILSSFAVIMYLSIANIMRFHAFMLVKKLLIKKLKGTL